MGEGDDAFVIQSSWPRWLRWRNIAIVAALAALGSGVAWGPGCMVRHAHERWIACVNRLYETAVGTGDRCREDGWVWLPKHVPWTKREARQLASDMARDAAEDDLKIAGARDLDPAARDRAAAALLAADRADPPPRAFFTTGGRLHSFGATTVLLDRAADLAPDERMIALGAAIRIGNAAAVKRIAALGGAPPDNDADRRRGAIECALGDRAVGMAALEQADRTFFKETSSHDSTSQWAMIACEPEGLTVSFDEPYKNEERVVRAFCGGGRERIDPDAYHETAISIARLLLMHRSGAASARRYLAAISPVDESSIDGPSHTGMSPWALLDNPGDLPVSPALADDTGVALEALAATAKPAKPRTADDADPVAETPSPEALAAPAGYLRWAALLVDLEAAYGWTRRGDVVRAAAAAHRAADLVRDPNVVAIRATAPMFVVPVLELVGDWTAAAKLLDELAAIPGQDPSIVAIVAIDRALAFMHDGKPALAWTALDPAIGGNIDERLRGTARWLRLALAVATGKPADIPLPEAPATLHPAVELPGRLAYWYAAAHADPAAQAMVRWQSYDELEAMYVDTAVLPAIFYLVGKVAGTGDVELWLDIITSSQVSDAQALASARAEAARWRGDAAAAKRWDDRLAAIRALAPDDRAEFLIRGAEH